LHFFIFVVQYFIRVAYEAANTVEAEEEHLSVVDKLLDPHQKRVWICNPKSGGTAVFSRNRPLETNLFLFLMNDFF